MGRGGLEPYGALLLRVVLGVIYIAHAYLVLRRDHPGQVSSGTSARWHIPLPEIGVWYLLVAHGLGGIMLILGFLCDGRRWRTSRSWQGLSVRAPAQGSHRGQQQQSPCHDRDVRQRRPSHQETQNEHDPAQPVRHKQVTRRRSRQGNVHRALVPDELGRVITTSTRYA